MVGQTVCRQQCTGTAAAPTVTIPWDASGVQQAHYELYSNATVKCNAMGVGGGVGV